MVKTIKFILCVVALFFAFFSGVKYSEEVKNMSGWIFEAKEKEVDFQEIQENIRKSETQDSLEEKEDLSAQSPSIDPDALEETEVPATEEVKPAANPVTNPPAAVPAQGK